MTSSHGQPDAHPSAMQPLDVPVQSEASDLMHVQIAAKYAFLEDRYRRRMAEIGALIDQQKPAVETLLTEEDQFA